MNKEVDIKNASCTKLSMSAPVQLKKDNKESPGTFEIEAYTGAAVSRWWGKLSIDLNGIRSSDNMPVFLNHEPSQIVGWANKSSVDGSFRVFGKFSKTTKAAKEAAALADEGFPWQASIGVSPLKILSIEEGAMHNVNGQEIIGPAEVWTESEVFETSFVPLGADSSTSIATFSKVEEKLRPTIPEFEKNNNNEGLEKMDITQERLEKEAPDLLSSIKEAATNDGLSAGAKSERERIESVLAQSIPGHEDLIKKLAFDGKTTGPEAAVQVLAAEKKLRAAAAEDLNADAPDPVKPEGETAKTKKPATPEEEFTADVELQKEFGDVETYLAYIQATSKGLVKSLKNKVD